MARAQALSRNRLLRFVVPILLCSPLLGEDRVVLQKPGWSSRTTVTGTIENFTGEFITIRGNQGQATTRYRASEVVEIQTPQTESQVAGIKLLAEGQIEQATAQLLRALKEESRVWVRREILASLIQCALRRNDYSSAASRFEILFDSDPATQYFKFIPLVWAPQEIPDDLRIEAQTWLDGRSEVIRLIGASILFNDKRAGPTAAETLKQLSSSSDPRIKSLAQAQGWRRSIAAGSLGKAQLEHWQDRIDAMPQDLRAGPYYLLGRAYLAHRDYALAATALLWLPLVDDHDYNLAARACLEAGVALATIGQHAEASALFTETTARFKDSPFAGEALGLLKKSAPRQNATPGGTEGPREDAAATVEAAPTERGPGKPAAKQPAAERIPPRP